MKVFLFLFFLIITGANACPSYFILDLNLKSKIKFNDYLERFKNFEEVTYLRQSISQTLISHYLSKRIHSSEVEFCLKNLIEEEQNEILNLLSKEALDQTLELLRGIESEVLQSLLSQIKPDTTIAFKVLVKELPGTSRPAQISRNTNLISSSLQKMNRDEWLLVFVHELSHRLDKTWHHAIEEYSRPSNLSQMFHLLKKFRSLDELLENDREFLFQQIQYGLDRGLFAEHRAWTKSFLIYKDLKSQNQIGAIQWIEEILKEKTNTQTMSQFVYFYLAPRFRAPQSLGVFDNPLWTQAYQHVLKKYEENL